MEESAAKLVQTISLVIYQMREVKHTQVIDISAV